MKFLTGYNDIFNVTNSNNKFFSRKQLPTEVIIFKLLYHQVLMKLKVSIRQPKEKLIMKNISPNQIIQFKLGQIFQH